LNDDALQHPAGSRTRRAYVGAAALFVLACFATVACDLRKFEFSNGGENAVVASVLEMRRGGPWLVPTLHEEVRTKKPPLTTWLSAFAARPRTVARLSEPDPAARANAYEDFAWQVRWPSLAAMCGLLVATYALASSIGGPRLGLAATIVCGSSIFWLRNARLVTTDDHLALWVTAANSFFACAVLKRQWWSGIVLGAVALGLAMMSKGPVALLQTALPVIAFVAWRALRGSPESDAAPDARGRRLRWLAPLLVGLLVFVVVGLSWYGLVLLNNPNVRAEWLKEVTREGATDMEPSRWYNYVLLIPHLFPWSFFFVVGLIGSIAVAIKRSAAARDHRIVFALSLLLVPVLVMSFFRDREIRYLIPFLAPASIVAAWGMLELLAGAERARGAGVLVVLLHWIPLLLVTAGLTVLASPLGPIKSVDGGAWYALPKAVAIAAMLAVLVFLAALAQRRWGVWAVPVGTALIMLAWTPLLNVGYRSYREGRSEMRPLAEQILTAYPQAKVYSFRPDRPVRHAPIDLSIYLNRTVENVADPAEMGGTTGPRVYVVRQRHKTPVPDPMSMAPPAGGPWGFFSANQVDNSMWYAFAAR
jgi:4-amino-4-deoxy-L-arabinose transferase-like glycosyltransferase